MDALKRRPNCLDRDNSDVTVLFDAPERQGLEVDIRASVYHSECVVRRTIKVPTTTLDYLVVCVGDALPAVVFLSP